MFRKMKFFVLWSYIIVTNIAVAILGTNGKQQIRKVVPKNGILLVETAEQEEHFQRIKRDDSCPLSHTQVDGKSACKGERLFHDSFSGSTLNTRLWSHEIFMPTDPNYEFVVFDDNPQIFSARNGRFHIKPSVYEDEFVRSGRLELSRCTGRLFTEECVKQARTFFILPPIKSARITTKKSFAFKYGKVQVRARLPIGDWIIPEIWLEPKGRVYGPSLSSGRIRLAFARGNKDLTSSNGAKIGINRLESGIIMGTPEKGRGRSIVRDLGAGWHSKFHNYTLIWEPDNISFMVDGEEREYLIPDKSRMLSEIVGFDQNESNNWQSGSSIAPFDQEFYISLGLSVGGMKDFPDNCVSGSHPKPWKNNAVKALVNFWRDREHWQPTWDDKTILEVEHVTVHAL